jgi:hypothetical protein
VGWSRRQQNIVNKEGGIGTNSAFLIVDQINRYKISGIQLIILEVGVEESIVNAPRITITDQLFQSNLTFCGVFLRCRLTSGRWFMSGSKDQTVGALTRMLQHQNFEEK